MDARRSGHGEMRARRVPLVERRRRQRVAARARIVAQAATHLSESQRRVDPLQRSRTARLGLLPLLGSLLLHGSIVGIGVVTSGTASGTRERLVQSVAVEVRPPPPPPPPPIPEPAPRAPEPAAPPPPALRKPKPVKVAPEPEPATPAAPRRVVGLSLESTVEGGGGPSFAVGNTRLGGTEAKAQAVPAGPPPSQTNATASRIPSAGVAYALPVRKGESKPVYPPLLKSQGLEANVTVLLQLDAGGAVTKVQIVKPAAYPEFNEAARRAALSERFAPATRDGVAIPYTLSFTYRFRLEDS